MSNSISEAVDLDLLRSQVRGEVTTPADDVYDDRRKLFYGGVDPRPGAIVRVVDARDVAMVVQIARESGIDLAVRSGGHSLGGHSTATNGLVIDVRGLQELEIDPSSATAWAGTGVTAGEFTNAAGQHGIGTSFGDSGSVGLGGIALGGGVGFLVRKYGLTIDSLLAAEVVTADGEILRADEANHPDLFWAIRGGGGNFGVATRLKLALNPVDPFVGGILMLPASREVIEGFMRISESAPDELSTIANIMSAPPMPFIPEELVGSTIVIGMIAWCGEINEGQLVMEEFRSLAEAHLDTLGVMPYQDMYQPEEEDYAPTAVARTGFADEVESNIGAIVDEIAASDAPLRVVQLRALGGALGRIPDGATAYAHRDRKFMLNVAAFYEGEEDLPRREAWVNELAEVLTGGDPHGYVGFLADESCDRVRAAYPGATWDRLRVVKAKYDPDNLFRRNQNIPPAD